MVPLREPQERLLRVPVPPLAARAEPERERKEVALVELEAEWQVGWLEGVRPAFLSGGALDRVPKEKSELQEWVKAGVEQEESVWVLGFLKIEPDSVSQVELKQELEQKAERVMRVALSTAFLLQTNSSVQ